MRRTDLAFVVGRAIAIWLVAASLNQFPVAFSFLSQDYVNDRGFVYASFGAIGLNLGLAWLLWFSPTILAGREDPTPSAAVDHTDIRDGMYAAVGLFFLCYGITNLPLHLAGLSLNTDLREVFGSRILTPLIQIIVGGAIFLRFNGGWRAQVRSAREAAAKAWSVGDPEEMKDEK